MSYLVRKDPKTQLTKFGLYCMMRGIDRQELSRKSGVPLPFIYKLCRQVEGQSQIPTNYSHTFFPNLKKLMKALNCTLTDII